MIARERPDTIDARALFRIYGTVAGLSGIVIIGWGPAWLGTVALTRVFAAMLVASGCWAEMLSQVDDPGLRRRGLLWFGAAHYVILLVSEGLVRGRAPDQVLQAARIVAIFLMATAFTGRKRRLASPRGKGGATEPLRSRYEQQIRQAGAQEERNRLARDLHDSIKQQIFVIQTAAATAQARFDNDRTGAASALEQIRDSARDAMTEMEVMMDQLRSVPMENTGLVEALRKQCEALGHRTGARVDFRLGHLIPNEMLPPGSHQAILRVAQEALANIGRHARASNVTVSLDSVADGLELSVRDDGTGFDPLEARRGMGIANMRARADEFGGRFDLTSRSGSGTTVTFSTPSDEFATPAGYRRRTYLSAAALVGMSLYLIFGARTATGIFLFLICAMELALNFRAWHRARNLPMAKT